MTDDMAASDLEWMPRTQRLLGERGMTFQQGLSANPWCCPARATLLTGQESHNNDVWSNKGVHGGYGALEQGPRLPDWLRRAGYRTAFIGKHLNGYRPEDARLETGWNVLDAIVRGVYSYRSFTTWDSGERARVRNGYITEHLRVQSKEVIRRFDHRDRHPFFLWVSHVAPHVAAIPGCTRGDCWQPAIPAPRDLGDLAGVRSPTRELPSWNHPNDETKPPFMRDWIPVPEEAVDTEFQRRIEALQSVDRSVVAIVRALRERDELDQTLLVFTSDNGYMLGQHRNVGKRLPYEESIRVPLLVRGPGVPAGARTDQMTTATDLTRTIVELAGADPDHPLDGVSMLPDLTGEELRRGATILQNGADVADDGDSELGEELDDRGWLYRGYRDSRWTYVRYPDPAGPDTPPFEELFDRDADPYQLHNLAVDPAYGEVLQRARARAGELADCAGSACHPDWQPLAGPGGATRHTPRNPPRG
jgi:arylsulfatase A-like enzyme